MNLPASWAQSRRGPRLAVGFSSLEPALQRREQSRSPLFPRDDVQVEDVREVRDVLEEVRDVLVADVGAYLARRKSTESTLKTLQYLAQTSSS